jgi:hypothetical protein
MIQAKWTRSLAVVVLASVAVIADAQTKLKPGFNLFSPQDDVQIGQQSAIEAEQQLPILNDPQITAYVNSIGQRLAANANGPQFQYHFKVVNSSDINAFALPGGFVYINRGILDNARNEGEVAGVMAHEISHVALRHGTHQASKAYLAQAGISILGGLLGGKVGAGTAEVINAIGGFGLNALFLKYSRDIETQADVRGSQILTASGYTPVDMINFFKTLERVDPSKKTNFLADHPAPPDRIARIEQEARLLHVSDTPTENVAQLRNIQSRLGGFGASRSTPISQASASSSTGGRTRTASRGTMNVNVPAPSNSWNSFTSRAGVYRVSYPSNWQAYDSGSFGVTIAPPGGIGNVNGTSDVVYGALINHYDPFGNMPAGNISLQSATQDLVAEIQRGSSYLRLVNNSAQRLQLAGGTGLAATLRGVDPATGIDERVTVVTRQLSDEHLLYLLFITPERDAANYNNVLNEMVRSLQINPSQPH